jgi:hypothetical protein
MRRSLVTLALFALALALPVAAAQASAAGGHLLPPLMPRKLMAKVGAPVPPVRSYRAGFQVEAAGGYEVGVSTFGSSVILVVSREHAKSFSETLYLARGVATPDRLQATFGQFGKVKMRFREASAHRVCDGPFELTRHKGVWVGNLRFKGEGGYVSVRLHRAVGGILEPIGLSGPCIRNLRHRRHSHGGGSHHFNSPAALFAQSREGVDTTSVLALEFFGVSGVLATHEESRGKLAILRAALVYTHPAFRVNETATAAKLAPPGPFHGSGHYRAAPDGTYTWSGGLSANFPGAPRFPLTGPQFKVFLEAPF